MKTLLLLLAASMCFSQQLLLNTYDHSGYLLLNDQIVMNFNFQYSQEVPFRSYIVDWYSPPKILVDYIPLPKQDFFITAVGKTIGTTMTDIVLPESIYKKVTELFQSGAMVYITVDRYPIEIYQDHILVVEYDKQKIEEFLPHFIDYDLSKITKAGKYPLEPSSVQIDWAVAQYNGLGGAIIPIFKDQMYTVLWSVDGTELKGPCVVFPTGQHSVEAKVNANLWHFNFFVDEWRYSFEEKAVEMGSNLEERIFSISGLDIKKLTIPGTFIFLKDIDGGMEVQKVKSIDSTSPVLKLNLAELSPGIFELSTDVEDLTACTVEVLVNGERVEMTKGILSLENRTNVVVAIAKDTFENKSYAIKQIVQNTRLDKEGMISRDREVVFDIFGIPFYSPYVKWWLAKDVNAKVMASEKRYFIEAIQ
ncbi:MAG: hypothetical protein WHT65_03265 [Pseudothermotoga sp.]